MTTMHYFADKGPSSQSYGFSSSYAWMWELDRKGGWVPKNWSFWTVVLEKALENPLDSNEIKLVNSKGNQPWIFIGMSDAEAEAPIFWSSDVKSWLTGKVWERHDAGKDWRQRRRVQQKMRRLYSITNSTYMNLSKLWEIAEDRGAWHSIDHEISKS